MLPTLPLLMLAFALHAQDDPPSSDFYTLGRDNARFARELFRAGYADLATTLCTRVEASAETDSDEVASVRSVHLDLKIEAARSEKDPQKKVMDLAQLLKAKEEFIEAYPEAPEAREAEANLPDVYGVLGEAYTEALKATDDPGELKRLRGEGSDLFRRGESSLNKRVEELNEALSNLNEETGDAALIEKRMEALALQHMTAYFNLARTYYFHASLLGADDPFGKTFFEKAIETFTEFGLEYEDRLLYFHGLVMMGLAHSGLKLYDDALADFDEAIRLSEQYDPGTVSEDAAAVIAWAVIEKMKLLEQLGQPKEAIRTATEFIAAVPIARGTDQGLTVLDSRMKLEVDSGDNAAARKTAEEIAKLDPRGWFGQRANQVLGNLGVGGAVTADASGVKNLLKIAQSLASKKDYEQSIRIGQQAVASSRALPKPGDEVTETFLLIGTCYWYLGQLEQAAVAYDAAYESNPAAKRAGDALYQASQAYRELSKQQRRKLYDKLADERLQQLSSRFPKHRMAAEVALTQASKLKADGQFAQAAEAYLKVPADSPVYVKAQFEAALCLFEQTRALSREKKPETKASSVKVEAQLRNAQKVAEAKETLDLEEQDQLKLFAYQTRSLLGQLFMIEAVGRPSDALAVADDIEARYAGDEDKLGEARSLRVRALTALGRVQEAKDFLEALIAKDPSSLSTAAAAGVLARTFDQQAITAFEKSKTSSEADELWKQAFRYYVLSMKPKLAEGASVRADELEDVATRLFVMGMHFNGVPEQLTSPVGWDVARLKAPEYWNEAATLYEAAVAASSSSLKARLYLARTYVFLGRAKDAADVYAKVVEDETLIDPVTQEINPTAIAGRPELMNIYLELGISTFEVGRAEREDGQLQDAGVIFDRIVRKSTKESEVWWQARYHQIRAMYEAGEYKKADFALSNLETTTNDFDQGKFGMKPLFEQLKKDLKGKVNQQGTSTTSGKPR